MGWDQAGGGPERLTPRATALLTQIDQALAEARLGLAAADRTDWVSAAADRYRALLDETARGLVRLESATAESWLAVLRHTRSCDDASAAALGGDGRGAAM